MPACLRCRTLVSLVETDVLLHVLCCPVEGRLKVVLLCLRYVDTVAFGAWLCLRGVRRRNKNFVVVCVPRRPWLAGLMIHTTHSFEGISPRRVPPQQSRSPRGWHSPLPLFGLRRAPVSRTCHAHTSTRVLPAAVIVLLYCGWLCCYSFTVTAA